MNDNLHNILDHSDCPSAEELKKYLKGELSKNEVRRVEVHLAECEMCSDELEGLSLLKDNDSLAAITNSLNAEIDNRSGQKKGLVIPFKGKVFAAAAAVLLIGVIITTFVLTKKSIDEPANIAQKQVYEELNEKPIGNPKNGDTDSTAKSYGNRKEVTKSLEIEKETVTEDEPKEKVVIINKDIALESDAESFEDVTVYEPASAFTSTATGENTSYTYAAGNQGVYDNLSGTGTITLTDTLKITDNYFKNDSSLKVTQNDLAQALVNTDEIKLAMDKESKAVSITSIENKSKGVLDKRRYKKTNVEFDKNNESAVAEVQEMEAVESKEEDEVLKPDINQAIVQYNNNQHVNSINTLNSLIKNNPKDEASLYYLGLNYQANNQDSKAIKSYDKVIELKGKDYFNKAKYQKALILIKQKKYDEAKSLLNDIIKEKDDLKIKADSLIQILK